MRAGDDERADAQRAALHQHGRDRAAAAIEPRLDHRALGVAVGIGDEVEKFGLQSDRFEQLVEVRLLGRGDFDGERFAAEGFDLNVVLQQFLHHALRIGVRLVDLVDRDDDRRVGRLGVADRLDRLRHHAVVGGHHQHDDVGHLGAARAHRGEGVVAGRVDEGDLGAAGGGDLIGADMLGDAARFAGHHVGVADGVEQRRLAVVDVAHDGDDRRPRDRRALLVGTVEQPFFDVRFGDALDGVAHFLGDELRGVGVERVGQGDHAALTHQQLDDVDGALGHAVGEFLDGDRLGKDDFAGDLLFRLLGAVAFEALGAAAEGGDGTRALFLAGGGAGDGQTAAIALIAAARRARRRQHDFRRRSDDGGSANDALALLLLADDAGGGRFSRARRGGHGRRARRRPVCGPTWWLASRRARRRRGVGAPPPRIVA